MNNYSTVDRESFQELLASAFAVQQLDSQARSLFVEVGRLVTRGDLDVDGAVHLIGHRTRNPANTTGVGMLSADIARELALKDIAEQADLVTKVGAAAKLSTPPPRDKPSTAADSEEVWIARFRNRLAEGNAALFRPRDLSTPVLVISVIALVLLGWMLGRVMWL